MRGLCLTVVFLAGCVSGGGSSDDAGPVADLALDAAPLPDDGVVVDAAVDMAPDAAVEQCGPTDVTVRADADEGAQFHPAIAADGDGLWVVYNRVTPDASTFDVWATRLNCDGSVDIPPFEVSADPVDSDVDPSVAVGPAGVMFAWSQDLADAEPNLVTRVRAYDHDGTPRGPGRVVETTRGVDPFDGGAWMVQVAATDEGFVVAGARGIEARSAFQVYAQRLDGEGAAVGPTASAERDMTQQLEPDVAVLDDGAIWLVWGQGDQGAGTVEAALWRGDAELMPSTVLPAPAGSARVAGGERVLVMGHVERRGGADISVRRPVGDRRIFVGAEGEIDVQPALATVGDRAVLAWFRRIRGNQSEVWLQRLDVAADPALIGNPVQVPTEAAAAPYPMAVAALADGRVALAWAEGVSPDFRVMIRYVAP